MSPLACAVWPGLSVILGGAAEGTSAKKVGSRLAQHSLVDFLQR